MKQQIRQAAKNDFTVIYELICELVEAESGAIPVNSLKDIYLENLSDDKKTHFVVETLCLT